MLSPWASRLRTSQREPPEHLGSLALAHGKEVLVASERVHKVTVRQSSGVAERAIILAFCGEVTCRSLASVQVSTDAGDHLSKQQGVLEASTQSTDVYRGWVYFAGVLHNKLELVSATASTQQI